MKASTLVLCGCGLPLLGPAASSADVIGMTTTREEVDTSAWVSDPGGTVTLVRAYAILSEGFNIVLAVGATPAVPLTIRTIGGTFYQHPLGTDTAPVIELTQFFPSIEYDTFVTIGRLTSTDDFTQLSPGWPGFEPAQLAGEDLSWFLDIPESIQGLANADGLVLIGQFTVVGPGVADVAGCGRITLLSRHCNFFCRSCFCSIPPEAAPDCNGNLVPDPCDIAQGMSVDADEDGVPDECTAIVGDLDGDGVVGMIDLLMLLASWGPCPPPPICAADLLFDGDVNVFDLMMLLEHWS